MADQLSALNSLLKRCQEVMELEIPNRQLFFDAPQNTHLHHVPRLLIFTSGETVLDCSVKGRIEQRHIQSPAIIYSSAGSYCRETSFSGALTAFSFSYYKDYIRSMVIYRSKDPANPPPEDIYYHTESPLSAAGFALLETIEKLHNSNCDDVGADLLLPLYKLTIRELRQSTPTDECVYRKRVWARICTLLRSHCHEPITRREVAEWMRISPGYVSILCKRNSQQSFSQLKLSYQLERAEKLLRSGNMNIEETALNSGFTNSNYFIRRFRQRYGVSPGAYRNSIRQEN